MVAKGFTQIYGIDYQKTFALIAKINSIRILLSVTVNFDWLLYQLDVKNAFLNGDLVEEVFMDLPLDFEVDLGVNKVCKLKKSLYGLGKVVMSYGFNQNQADRAMFYKHTGNGKVVVLIVYVDDVILTGNDEISLNILKKKLTNDFQMTWEP